MKIILIYIFSVLLIACGSSQSNKSVPSEFTSLSTISSWETNHSSNQMIYQQGVVWKILQDDNEGSRHQKFIVKLSNDQTLLVSHNIDLAERIPDLQNNDSITFKGEYEWNRKGGVVHWTHHDPKGKHQDGFLIHKGKTYQ
jgi:hypothetical protein